MSKIRYIINAFKYQKMKFFLMFGVTFLTLLIFNISTSLRESVINTRLGQLRDTTQNSQIVVSAKDGTYKEFDETIFWNCCKSTYDDDIINSITRDYCYVDVEGINHSLFLYGTDVNRQVEIYDFQLESGNVDDWKDDEILISSAFAKDNQLRVGDTLKLQYGEKQESMQVKAISKEEGMFLNAYDFAITSTAFVDRIGNRKGLVNRIDLTISDLKKMDEITRGLNDELKGTGLSAISKYNLSYFQGYVSTVVLALNLFSIFLLLLTVYMLYSLFQSYVYENVGQLATLRSIGFTIRDYRVIVCSQVMFIVLVAFLFSIVATPVAMKLLGGMMFQQNTKVEYHLGMMLLKGLAVLFLAVVSIYVASYKVSRTEIVSLIRNHVSYHKQTFHKKRLLSAILVFIVAIVVEVLNHKETKLYYCYASLITLLIAFLLFQELLIRVYGTILHKIFGNKRKSIGLFGKQIKTSLVSYLPAVTSLVFILSIAMCILSMSAILKQAMGNMYKSSDFYMTIQSSDTKSCLDVLDKTKEIKNYIVQFRKTEQIEAEKVQVTSIEDGLKDDDYKMFANCENYQRFDELQHGNNIVISDTLAKRWNKKTGDKISIADKELEIIQVIKTFENMGEIVFISEKTFRNTFAQQDNCAVLIQASNRENLEGMRDMLQEELDKVGDAKIVTTKEMYKSNMKANQVIVKVIFAFACVILIVSGIGLCSVVIINILLRKREFLVFRTIGISRCSILKIACLEAAAVSIYAFLNALCIQKALLKIMVEILSYYVGNLSVKQSISSSIVLFVMVFIVTAGIFMGVTRKYALSDSLIDSIKVS